MNQNFIQQAREALTANYAQAGQAARDLLTGFVTGRENPIPGMPGQMEQMLEMLGQGRRRNHNRTRPADPAEEDGQEDQGRQQDHWPPAERRASRRGATSARRRGNVVAEGA
jgi:hypothetical protein